MKHKISSEWKGAILGGILAILLTMSMFTIATQPHNILDEFDVEPISWNMTSSIQLSQQIDQYSNQLLSVEISPRVVTDSSAYIIDDTGHVLPVNIHSYRLIQYFDYNTSEVSINYISSKTALQHLVDPVDGYYRFMDAGNEVDEDPMIKMHRAFSQDIVTVNDPASYTGAEINNMTNNLEAGDTYWVIKHIYADGTYMEITIFDSLLILRIIQLDYYESYMDSDGYPSRIIGPIWQDVIYPTYVTQISGDTILPNYVDAVNEFLGEMYGE